MRRVSSSSNGGTRDAAPYSCKCSSPGGKTSHCRRRDHGWVQGKAGCAHGLMGFHPHGAALPGCLASCSMHGLHRTGSVLRPGWDNTVSGASQPAAQHAAVALACDVSRSSGGVKPSQSSAICRLGCTKLATWPTSWQCASDIGLITDRWVRCCRRRSMPRSSADASVLLLVLAGGWLKSSTSLVCRPLTNRSSRCDTSAKGFL